MKIGAPLGRQVGVNLLPLALTCKRPLRQPAVELWRVLLLLILLGIPGSFSSSPGTVQEARSSRGAAYAQLPGIPRRRVVKTQSSHRSGFSAYQRLPFSPARMPLRSSAKKYFVGPVCCSSSLSGELGLEDMRAFVENNGIAAEFISIPRDAASEFTPSTAKATADFLRTDVAKIAKSILFVADDQPLMVVLCCNMTVDTQKLLGQLNSPENIATGTWAIEPAIRAPVSSVALASRQQAESICGFRVGTIGPFGHPLPIATVVDKRLAVFDQVFAGCGQLDVEMRLDTRELIRVAACDGTRLYLYSSQKKTRSKRQFFFVLSM